MTLISSLNKQDQLPTQATQKPDTIRLEIGRPVPKLSDAMLSYQASQINKLPLEKRIASVQALNLPQELETKLIQFGIEQKLTKVCDNREALLATFQ
ncbi:MAG: hypothetical protein KBF71_02550, partial [Alphaproteobacteria bacterium]|nr:hypothetical protein [Alphaproteobacteria bacterium]